MLIKDRTKITASTAIAWVVLVASASTSVICLEDQPSTRSWKYARELASQVQRQASGVFHGKAFQKPHDAAAKQTNNELGTEAHQAAPVPHQATKHPQQANEPAAQADSQELSCESHAVDSTMGPTHTHAEGIHGQQAHADGQQCNLTDFSSSSGAPTPINPYELRRHTNNPPPAPGKAPKLDSMVASRTWSNADRPMVILVSATALLATHALCIALAYALGRRQGSKTLQHLQYSHSSLLTASNDGTPVTGPRSHRQKQQQQQQQQQEEEKKEEEEVKHHSSSPGKHQAGTPAQDKGAASTAVKVAVSQSTAVSKSSFGAEATPEAPAAAAAASVVASTHTPPTASKTGSTEAAAASTTKATDSSLSRAKSDPAHRSLAPEGTCEAAAPCSSLAVSTAAVPPSSLPQVTLVESEACSALVLTAPPEDLALVSMAAAPEGEACTSQLRARVVRTADGEVVQLDIQTVGSHGGAIQQLTDAMRSIMRPDHAPQGVMQVREQVREQIKEMTVQVAEAAAPFREYVQHEKAKGHKVSCGHRLWVGTVVFGATLVWTSFHHGRIREIWQQCSDAADTVPKRSGWLGGYIRAPSLMGVLGMISSSAREVVPLVSGGGVLSLVACYCQQLGLYWTGIVAAWFMLPALLSFLTIRDIHHSWQLVVLGLATVGAVAGSHVVGCLGGCWTVWLLLWELWCGTAAYTYYTAPKVPRTNVLLMVAQAIVLPMWLGWAPFTPRGAWVHGQVLQVLGAMYKLVGQ